jgi:hypothetical protein
MAITTVTKVAAGRSRLPAAGRVPEMKIPRGQTASSRLVLRERTVSTARAKEASGMVETSEGEVDLLADLAVVSAVASAGVVSVAASAGVVSAAGARPPAD